MVFVNMRYSEKIKNNREDFRMTLKVKPKTIKSALRGGGPILPRV